MTITLHAGARRASVRFNQLRDPRVLGAYVCDVQVVDDGDLSAEWAVARSNGRTTTFLPVSTRLTLAVQGEVCSACRRLGGTCVPGQRSPLTSVPAMT